MGLNECAFTLMGLILTRTWDQAKALNICSFFPDFLCHFLDVSVFRLIFLLFCLCGFARHSSEPVELDLQNEHRLSSVLVSTDGFFLHPVKVVLVLLLMSFFFLKRYCSWGSDITWTPSWWIVTVFNYYRLLSQIEESGFKCNNPPFHSIYRVALHTQRRHVVWVIINGFSRWTNITKRLDKYCENVAKRIGYFLTLLSGYFPAKWLAPFSQEMRRSGFFVCNNLMVLFLPSILSSR